MRWPSVRLLLWQTHILNPLATKQPYDTQCFKATQQQQRLFIKSFKGTATTHPVSDFGRRTCEFLCWLISSRGFNFQLPSSPRLTYNDVVKCTKRERKGFIINNRKRESEHQTKWTMAIIERRDFLVFTSCLTIRKEYKSAANWNMTKWKLTFTTDY